MFAFFPLVAKVPLAQSLETMFRERARASDKLFVGSKILSSSQSLSDPFKHSFATEKIEIDLRRIIGIIGFDDELMTANTSL